jgi:hypothetical protein
MFRRAARALWPLALLILVLSCRATGCRKKAAAPPSFTVPAGSPPYRITVLMTPPPPRPTVTMWKGVTRAPQLPE